MSVLNLEKSDIPKILLCIVIVYFAMSIAVLACYLCATSKKNRREEYIRRRFSENLDEETRQNSNKPPDYEI